MAKTYCEVCGKENPARRTKLENGKMACSSCNKASQDVANMDIAAPEVIVWAGEIAKMGKDKDGSQRTVVIIPKSQRYFLKTGQKYSFLVRKL